MSETTSQRRRYTLRGSAKVEARIAALICEVVTALKPVLNPSQVRVLCLIGGYGRGEGGVETDEATGEEKPHNNLDLLLILRGSPNAATTAVLKKNMDACLVPIIAAHHIGIDVGMTSEAKLDGSPCLVMWYDMRHGHRTLWGDPSYLPGLTRFCVESIPAWDARNLLTNRGTLLIINAVLLATQGGAENLTSDQRRAFIRHHIKAIIGYGDALLYFGGAYHWSYEEKQKRMRTLAQAAPSFRALYETAMEFRFAPNYAPYRSRDLEAWGREIRDTLAPVHLECERMRLSLPTLTWPDYLNAALTNEFKRADTPQALARRAYRFFTAPKLPPAAARFLSPPARAGFRCTGGLRGSLPCLFPLAAYGVSSGPELQAVAGALLGISDSSANAVQQAYLRAWGTHGDINFGAVLEKLGLNVAAGQTSQKEANR